MMERLKESRWLYILVSVLIAVAFWLYIRNVQNTASDYTIIMSRSRSPTAGCSTSGD